VLLYFERESVMIAMSRFQKWGQFHKDNPQVWELFVRFAREAKSSGRDRMGARVIGERIRWYSSVETTGSKFKVNDHHWPYYARLLEGTDPGFSGFSTFKSSRFDSSTEEIVAVHLASGEPSIN
jgi:hypothetical protein